MSYFFEAIFNNSPADKHTEKKLSQRHGERVLFTMQCGVQNACRRVAGNPQALR